MAKEKSGVGIDSSGNAAVDPTANVLLIVNAAVNRINDLHTQEIAFNDKLRAEELKNINDKIENSIKRIDDLRDVQIRRLEENLNEHKQNNKTYNQETKENLDRTIADRDLRLSQKFESLAEAIGKAETATEKRFESVNEFRAVLTDQQRTLLPRLEYDAGHKNLAELVSSQNKTLSDIILAQKERIDKMDNLKQGSSNVWIIIVGVIGFVTGLISFILNLLGK